MGSLPVFITAIYANMMSDTMMLRISSIALPVICLWTPMADLYLKALEAERRSLWASARLKGLPKDSPERQRIAVLDADIAAHKAKAKTPKE